MLNGTLCFILAVKPSTVGFFFSYAEENLSAF